MKWHHVGDGSFQVAAVALGEGLRYDVFFKGPCARHFDSIGFRFNIGDELYLSLKGVTVNKKAYTSSALGTLPLDLVYERGVRLEFKSKKPPLQIGTAIEYWQRE